MDLSVITESSGAGRTVLQAVGSIDITSRERLFTAATPFTDQPEELVIDLSEVSFIDSTGIGALVTIASDVRDAGGSFAIRRPSRPVSRILETAGLAQEMGGRLRPRVRAGRRRYAQSRQI